MTRFVRLILIFGFLSEVASADSNNYVTAICELHSPDRGTTSTVEITVFDDHFGKALELAVAEHKPLEVQINIDYVLNTPATFQVERFGFEPGMYHATTQLIFGQTSWNLELTYDTWARPLVFLKMTVDGKELTGGCHPKK